MIPRSPSPVQCVRIFGVPVLLAAAAGMTSCAGLSSSSTSSSSSPTQQVPTNGIPTIYMGMQKKTAPYRDNPDLEYRSVPSASGTVGSPGKISTRLMEWMTGPYWMSG